MPSNKLSITFTPEINAQLKAHADKWIKHALGCEPCDREKVTRGILGMYAAAKLKAPRVVFVDSPYACALVYGAAAWWWYVQKNGPKATGAATDAATHDATYDATRAATGAATDAATDAATRAATRAATDAATDAATRAATGAATYDATRAATDAATHDATGDVWVGGIVNFCQKTAIAVKGAINCARNWAPSYQGGRMWGGWMSYLTSFRDMGWLKLKEYENFKHYEDAGDAGFRCLHEEFCVVTENPEFIYMDSQARPHSDDGPSHRWRDGWSLYHIHGVRVEEYIVMRPHEITVAKIKAEDNAEIRRIMIDRMGIQKYIDATGAKVVQMDMVSIGGGLKQAMPRALIRDDFGNQFMEGTDSSTERCYFMPVDPEAKTCQQAHESICGLKESDCIAQS
jgi:hypothetical protein